MDFFGLIIATKKQDALVQLNTKGIILSLSQDIIHTNYNIHH